MAGRTRLHSEIMFGDNVPDDDISFKNPKKRILFDEEASKTNEMSEHMKCYLRIRPLSEEEVQNNENQNCISIEDEHTVAAHAPKDSHTFKNCAHGLGKTTHKFKFSRIFDSGTTQKDFFNDTMLGLVKDFIDGQNCLVFTYGVTSSGKTYTIQGKPKDAGILPRALDVIFNSINGKQWPDNRLKPKMFMDVVKLSADQAEEDLRIKERTMKMVTFEEPDVMSLLGDDASDMSQISNITSCSERSNASIERLSKDSLDEVFSDLENRVREEAAVSVEDQGLIKFSVWVSFAEIYNEQIFDLLEPIPKKKTTRRPVLRLSDDRKGSPYIRGLKEIHVTSADEAYNLLTVGQKNLRTACTKLNHQSSRSHCIFNIKILRVVDKGNPNHARVSMLSLCDLAGSERHSKTQSRGDRLKEAGNINTSLMTLGRCIDILRTNQHHKDKTQLIPFRDSKLTRLFQNFFCGRGKAAMIVNVNQCASMFDETLHVFKFSAVAKQVVVVQKPDPPPKKRLKSVPQPKQAVRPSIPWATPGRADMSLMNSALRRGQEIPLPEDDDDDLEDYDSMDESERAELIRIIENLHEKLKAERRSKLFLERDVREEVCKEMMEQIVKIESEYEEQLREREILAEEMMERKIKILTDAWSNQKRKRPRQEVMEDEEDEWVSSVLLHQEQVKVQKKQEELEEVKDELEKVQNQLNKYISEQEDYIGKNTSLQFQLATVQKNEKEANEEIKKLKAKLDAVIIEKTRDSEVDLGNSCLLETLTQQLQEAKDQVSEQKEEIEELNAMLTEAGETFQQKEDKIKQLESLITELQAALEDSKQAVTLAEERLVKKDGKIVKLENQVEEFQETSKTQKNCNVFLEETLKQKEEEIGGLRSKLMREEGESTKREQALINGYKAEISVLKLQIQQMRSDSRNMSPVKSPMKKHREVESPAKRIKIDHESPRKCRTDSPVRKVKHDKDPEERKHYKEDVSQQIKDMQEELMKNLAATAELETALQVSRMKTEDLESRLVNEQKARNEVNTKVEEMGEKIKDYNKIKLELENETDARKMSEQEVEKLSAELKSLGDVKTLYDELKCTYDELEKDLATKVEENLTAGEKINKLESNIQCLTEDNTRYEQKLLSCLDNLEKMSSSLQKKDALTSESACTKGYEGIVSRLELIIQHCCQEWDGMTKALSANEENVQTLKEELSEKSIMNENLKEKMEELETVNASLRDMVNQTTNHIQAKETEIQEIVVESLQSCESPSSSNSLNNLKKKMRELKEEVENSKSEINRLVQENEKVKNSKLEIESEMKKMSENCKDLEFQLEEKSIEMTDILESKVSMETKVDELECKISELETVSKEKTNQLMELNDELNKMKVARDMLEEDLKDLEEERENMQAIIEVNSGLKRECEDVKQELDVKEKSMTDLLEKVDSLSSQVKEKAETVSKLKDQLKKLENGELSKKESLKRTMEMKEKEINDLKQKLEEQETVSEEKIQSIESELSTISDQLKHVTEVMEKAQKEASEFQAQNERMNRELSEAQESTKAKDITFEKEKQALLVRIEELSEKCSKLENSVTEIKEQCQECEKQRDTLKIQLENVMKEKDHIQNDLDTTTAKCNDLEKQNSHLESRSSSSDEEHTSLGDAKMKIAKLKSELHMRKTLHEKAKNASVEKDSVISRLEEELKTMKNSDKGNNSSSDLRNMEMKYKQCVKERDELECSCDQLRSELVNKKEEVLALDEHVATLEKENTDFKEQSVLLQGQLDEHVKEMSLLREDLDKSKLDLSLRIDGHAGNSKKEVDKLSKVCTQQEMLIREQNLKIKKYEKNDSEKQELRTELRKVKNDLESLEQELSKRKLEVEAYQQKTIVSDKELKNLNEAISQQQKLICQQSEKIKELMQCEGTDVSHEELNRIKSELKVKTEEVEVVKSRLDTVESDLIRITGELSSKEKVIENLQANLNQVRETECLSPSSQSHCARKLRKEKIEIENQLIEARYRIKQLESEAQSGACSSPRKLLTTDSLQRASVTSPTVHRELNRSQEREQNLRSQLQMASQTVKCQNEKISELEKELLETGTKLRLAEDNLKQRQSMYGTSSPVGISSEEMTSLKEESRRRWEMIQDLEKDLQKKETKIQTKTQTINNMKATMEMETEKFEAALKDAQANEAVIEELKNAIALQEETMEGQDRYIQQKEETINRLQQEVEKYTDKYHSLLTSSGDSSREIREMARENAKSLAEMEETKSKLVKIQSENSKLSEEIVKLQTQLKEKSEDLQKVKGENSDTEHLEKTVSDLKLSNVKNNDMISKLQQTIDELTKRNQKLVDEKMVLSTVIKENNEELKEMEKLLCEKRKEMEDLQSENNTQKLENIELKYQEQEKLVSDLKAKIKDKDHSLREVQKEMKKIKEELAETSLQLENIKSGTKERDHATSEQLQQKNKEIIKLQQEVEKKMNELNNWKQERDKLVQGLEGIMQKQQTEINNLKKQKSELEERLSQQRTTSRTRNKSGHSTCRRESAPVEDIVIKEEAPEVFQSPPRRPPPPKRGRKRRSPNLETSNCDIPSSAKKENVDHTFVSEEGDTSSHIEIDATPAIAAKNLRRARKKRSSVDLLREEKENKKSSRGRKAKAGSKNTETSLTRIMSVIKESPLTRSAKKFMESTPNKDSDSTVEVEDHGTQMSPAFEMLSAKKSRKRHQLYKDDVQISEPLDCGRYAEPSPDDVHNTVQRKLRGRRK